MGQFLPMRNHSLPRFCSSRTVFVFTVLFVASSSSAATDRDKEMARGKAIFAQQCADCHGDNGQGVEGAYESPLEGDLSVDQLISYVDETMPEGDPDACSGEDARLVTEYFMHAFYTREARLRNNPPKIEFARLTIDQYHNSVTDLMRPILGKSYLTERRGLAGKYFPDAKHDADAVVFTRIDPTIDFDFGEDPPTENPAYQSNQEFGMHWQGGLIASETGTYDIFVRSENGFRVFLNQLPYGQEPFIDNWVDANEGEYHASIKLRAGRVYPLTVQFQKYMEPTADISLQWKTPRGIRSVIPTRNLSPEWFPCVVNLQTEFPPDDSTSGYERGTSVSTEWDRATTLGALETLEFLRSNWETINREVVERETTEQADRYENEGHQETSKRRSKGLADEPSPDGQKRQQYRALSETFAKTAFRRPLSSRETQFFIERAFESSMSPELAFERIVLMTLKSPQFLYLPGFDQSPTAHDVATRLSMMLYDSLPDQRLIEAAESQNLLDPKRIRSHALRLVDHPGTRVKLHNFFAQWLETERAAETTKDHEVYPGFDDSLVASLQTSLELMVDNVVWSQSSDFRELLTSDMIFMDKAMAEFYSIDWDSLHERAVAEHELSADATFVPVSFEPAHRSGVLTHPFLMAGFSYHRTTSPIHRGVFVAKRILGRTLKSPPVDVEPLEEDFAPNMTTRQRVAHQTKGTVCQSCHSIINPLGFSFEHFDAVGRYRETEKARPINAASSYLNSQGESHSWTNATELADYLVNTDEVYRNFVEQLFQFMARQPLAAYGPDKSDQLFQKFRDSHFNVKETIVEMAILVATHQLEQKP
jgi:hypothetical protein